MSMELSEELKARLAKDHQEYLERVAKHARVSVDVIKEYETRVVHCKCHPWKHGMIKAWPHELESVMEYINYFTGAWGDVNNIPGQKEKILKGHGILGKKGPDGAWDIEFIYVCEGDEYGHNGDVKAWCGKSLLEGVQHV